MAVSTKLGVNFEYQAINQMPEKPVGILSVYQGKLAVASAWTNQIDIYCTNQMSTNQMSHFSTCTVPGEVWDMAWTSDGNIVCTLWKLDTIIIIRPTPSENILREIHLLKPEFLSISPDRSICIATKCDGVYSLQANDESNFNLRRIFQPTRGYHCWQVIAVPTVHCNHEDHDSDFNYWTLERKENEGHIRIYSVIHSNYREENFTCRELILPTSLDSTLAHCSLFSCKLAFYSNENVLLVSAETRSIYIWSLNGDFKYNLSLPIKMLYPFGMALDSEHNQLYIGHEERGVNVLTIS